MLELKPKLPGTVATIRASPKSEMKYAPLLLSLTFLALA